jgi:cephalosporin hydroxylase
LQELTMYNKLVKKGSYLVVSDTFIEDFPSGAFPDRPWGVGNNPATAVGKHHMNTTGGEESRAA